MSCRSLLGAEFCSLGSPLAWLAVTDLPWVAPAAVGCML